MKQLSFLYTSIFNLLIVFIRDELFHILFIKLYVFIISFCFNEPTSNIAYLPSLIF